MKGKIWFKKYNQIISKFIKTQYFKNFKKLHVEWLFIKLCWYIDKNLEMRVYRIAYNKFSNALAKLVKDDSSQCLAYYYTCKQEQ